MLNKKSLVPGRAHLNVLFLDCFGTIASNVELSLSPGAMSEDPVDPLRSTAIRKVQGGATTSTLVFNAKPGCVEIVGKVDGAVTHRMNVLLFADSITAAIPLPVDATSDPVFSCTPD